MAVELNNLVKEVLAAPCFGFVGTINDSNQPVITRFFDFKYDEQQSILTLYTFKNDAKRVINILSDKSKLAATISNAMDFKTVQFKGTYQRHYNVPDDEINHVRVFNSKQAEIMEMTGISRDVFASWKFEPSVAISINIEEIFDQTPKINTGNKIG